MVSPLDADQLKTFVTIAETGSFTQAAGQVAKTQSAVSMQMKRLEERVGRPLFEREGRNNKLTGDGERLLDYARRIVKLGDEALAVFSRDALEGRVCIGTPDDYADRFLPEILARFARSNPLVEVTVLCEPSHLLSERVAGHELDLAIVTRSCPYVAPFERDGLLQVFREEPLFWVTSERCAVHDDMPLPLALGRPTCNWRVAAIDALTEIGRPFQIRYLSWNATAVSAAVLAGLAVSVIPESALRPGMRILTVQDGFPALPSCEIALLRARGQRSAPADALARHIVESLGNVAPLAVAAE